MIRGTVEPFARAEYALYYELSPNFGAYAKGLREARGLSLRAAAEQLGVTFSYVQRLETGGRAAKPTLPLLERIAVVYGAPMGDVEAMAGVRREPLVDPDQLVHQQFRALVLHKDWRPTGMTEDWIDSYSVRQKRQIIQMLRQLGEHLKIGGRTPNELLAEAGLIPTGGA